MTDKTPPKAPASESTPAPAKSAAEQLLEMQLEEARRKAANPLAVTDDEVLDGSDKNSHGVGIVSRTTFANGTVVENYA